LSPTNQSYQLPPIDTAGCKSHRSKCAIIYNRKQFAFSNETFTAINYHWITQRDQSRDPIPAASRGWRHWKQIQLIFSIGTTLFCQW
jgi:hypothetical protein